MLTKDKLAEMGLREGRIRSKEKVHNGGWYASTGEKIGWGDLDESDFKNIQANLAEGELFVVLPESASFWNFVTDPAAFGVFCKVNQEERNPGQDYIIEHAAYIIAKDKVYGYSIFDERDEPAALIRSGK